MSDLGARLKKTIQDQSVNLKFIQLLNSNRPIQSLKDRQILPTIPLSAFNPTALPSIKVNKQKGLNKLRSKSQAKFKGKTNELANFAISGTTKQNNNIEKKQSQLMFPADKVILGSTKNLIKIRNRSVQSAHKSRRQTEQLKPKHLQSKKQSLNDQIVQSDLRSNGQAQNTQRPVIQFQITPQKLKLQLPPNATHLNTVLTKSNAVGTTAHKSVTNKTIQQISSQAIDNLMFNVKFGKIQQNISYKSFLKKDVKPTPIQIVRKLEQWLSKFKIKSGLIMTKNLHIIFAKKSISNNQILMQFTNYEQMRRELETSVPGLKYYGNDIKKGKNLAATKIQSLFRMVLQQKYTKKLRSLMKKVKLIQRKWKSVVLYKKMKQRILKRVCQKIENVKQLTQGLMKNWQFMKTSPRIQVHICSIALQQFKRLSIPDLYQKQICQLTRIFKCAQTDCSIVYITPSNLNSEILRYYQKIFSFGNKSDAFHNKLHIINLDRILEILPQNIPTCAALLYDSQSLNKIKTILKSQKQVMGQPCAYIVPSYPSNYMTNLAFQLGITILSSSQSSLKQHSTKSGSHQFFRNLSINLGDKCPYLLPRTVHSIYSEKQLINTLAVLIHKNKNINRWLLKIEDEVQGRGIAWFNVDSLNFLKQLRNNQENESQLPIGQKQIIRLIVDQLNMKLKSKLKIGHKQTYLDYQSYLSHFLTRGGVVQACIQPQSAHQKTHDHSISFKIQPNGEFQILTTYSRLYTNFRSIGNAIQCPSQLTTGQVDNQKIVRALYRGLWGKSKMFGYFTVDLICYKDVKVQNKSKQNEQAFKCYVIGMDCFLNEKTSSMYVPGLTCISQYNKQSNKLYIKKPIEVELKLQVKQTQYFSQRSQTSRSVTQQQEIQGSRLGTKQSLPVSTQKQKSLSYLYCPMLKLASLPPIPQFFKQCKFYNVSFDIQKKLGTLFLLQSGLEAGTFGFICIDYQPLFMRQQALKLIQFLDTQFAGSKNDKKKVKIKGKTNKHGRQELGQLRGYLMTMVRKNKPNGLNMKRQDLNLELFF